MRRNKTISLKEALDDLVSEYRLESGLKEASVINIWESIAGKVIMARTKKTYVRDGVLHIYLTSSVVRNELLMLRDALRARINSKAGEEVIRDIVIH
jgi:predicted nucleic acid-binding Zn ribbon protein